MKQAEFDAVARAFKDSPDMMLAFLANCREQGIPLPVYDDDPYGPGPDPGPKEPVRYDGPDGSSSSLLAKARTAEGRKMMAAQKPMPMGPVRRPGGSTALYACDPAEYRAAKARRT